MPPKTQYTKPSKPFGVSSATKFLGWLQTKRYASLTRGKTPTKRDTTTCECIRATTGHNTSTTDNNTSTRGNTIASTRGNTTWRESTPATRGIALWIGDNTTASDRENRHFDITNWENGDCRIKIGLFNSAIKGAGYYFSVLLLIYIYIYILCTF